MILTKRIRTGASGLKALFFIGILLIECLPAFSQTYDELVERYINTYREIAVEEMTRTGIPASITLAQGIIESNAGQSPLSTEANNHFGIKCHVGWTGETYTYDDDRKNECFRKYDSSLVSYKDHSDFLKNRSRYAVLFTYDPNDYVAWAKGLKSCGYATNPHYAAILVKCIEDYDLHQWDLSEYDRAKWFAALNKTEMVSEVKESGNPEIVNAVPTIKNAQERIYVFNDIKCVTLMEGESLSDLATTFEIGMKRFLRYNDLTDVTQVKTGDRIYLQPKRHNGDVNEHVVKENETMFLISRDHGIQLAKLYEKNLMKPGTQPAVGEVINLQSARKELPRLASDAPVSAAPVVQPLPAITAPGYYTVSKGDTLYSISKKYNVTVNELKSINNLKSSDIRVGEQLVISK